MSVNKVILLGRVGKDPETKYMPNGKAVVNFSLATSEKWTDKNGDKQEKTEWSNIVAYDKLAEIINEYVVKGMQLYVEGKIQTRSWDKDGVKHYMTEIIIHTMEMLGGKKDEDKPRSESPEKKPAPAQKKQSFDSFDDDIPF